MNRSRAVTRLVVVGAAAALTAGLGAGWASAETAPEFRWSRLDASIDVSTWTAGQVSGVVRVWGARAFSHLDDSPAARAIGSPMDVGILATASGFKGVPYPFTSESLSPGGADKAEFAEASKSIPGVVDAKQIFSKATTTANPPAAAADGGGQSAVTPGFTVSNYRATSNLADSGKSLVAGYGTVSLDGIVIGPLQVRNVTTLVDGATDGTEAGTKMSARTLVTGATVNGMPVEIGSSGVSAADQRVGGEGVAALNEQIHNALKGAGIFEVVVAEPKTSTGPNGLSAEAGGLRVKFVPTPEMTGAVNAAVPVEAVFASGRGNFLAVSRDGSGGGVAEEGFGGVGVEADPSSLGDRSSGLSPGSGPSGFLALPPVSAGTRAPRSFGGSSDVPPGTAAEADGALSQPIGPQNPSTAARAPRTDLQAQPVRVFRPSDRPWIAALGAFSAAVLAVMTVAARRVGASLAPSSLRQAMESLTDGRAP